jgi:hypothetical protein
VKITVGQIEAIRAELAKVPPKPHGAGRDLDQDGGGDVARAGAAGAPPEWLGDGSARGIPRRRRLAPHPGHPEELSPARGCNAVEAAKEKGERERIARAIAPSGDIDRGKAPVTAPDTSVRQSTSNQTAFSENKTHESRGAERDRTVGLLNAISGQSLGSTGSLELTRPGGHPRSEKRA